MFETVSMARTIAAWRKVDGLRFWGSVGVEWVAFSLRIGRYSNGHVAVEVLSERHSEGIEAIRHGGAIECKLTHNLVEKALALGEFHVRRETSQQVQHVTIALTELGVCHATGRIAQYGSFDARAEVWVLSDCTHDADRFAVECDECRDGWRKRYRAERAANRLVGARGITEVRRG